jgi:hypothetical protein
MLTGRTRKRHTIESEKNEESAALGSTFMTSVKFPGRSGLGKA